MFFELSVLHLCLMSALGSWLSWNKHFRWAVNFGYVKALWILFKCQNPRDLALNIFLYALFFNSSFTGKNEVSKSMKNNSYVIGLGNFMLFLQSNSLKFCTITKIVNSIWRLEKN